MLKIDHFLIGSRNIFRTVDQLREEAGLESYYAGWFPDEGLSWHVTPLGNDQFIEVEGVIDLDVLEDPNRVNRSGQFLVDRVRNGDALLGWWLLTDDLDGVCKRLSTPVHELRNTRPDGQTVTGRGTPVSIDALARGLPAFWTYDEMRDHPARTPVEHSVDSHGIAWVEVGGDEAELREWIGEEGNDLPIRYVGGAPGLRAVGVATSDREIEIRPKDQRLTV